MQSSLLWLFVYFSVFLCMVLMIHFRKEMPGFFHPPVNKLQILSCQALKKGQKSLVKVVHLGHLVMSEPWPSSISDSSIHVKPWCSHRRQRFSQILALILFPFLLSLHNHFLSHLHNLHPIKKSDKCPSCAYLLWQLLMAACWLCIL